MATDHDKDSAEMFQFPASAPRLKGGIVRVHDVETGKQVDRPDIAALGMGRVSQALNSAGVSIDGPVHFERPGNGDDAKILKLLDFEPTKGEELE